MKTILSILFIILISSGASAQIVNTFAGRVYSIGFNDGKEEATFNNPHDLAISQNGTIYVCDRFNHIIRKISLDGQVTTIAGQPGVSGDVDGQGSAARFYEPWGICVDQNENVFVADTRNNKIRKITPDGMVSTYAGTGNFGTSDGPLNNSTFGQPVGIEFDSNQNLYVADHGTHLIRKITADGMVSTLAGAAYETGDIDGLGTNARFNKPYGLTIDLEDNIIIADEWNHKIRKITPAGMVSTIAGLGIAGGENGDASNTTFNFPWDVAVDSSGFIYVADGLNYAIRKIAIDGNMETSTYAGKIGVEGYEDGASSEARFSGATGLAISPKTKELFVSDAFNQVIRKISDPQQGVFLVADNDISSYCPNEPIPFNVFPDVFDQFHYYVNDVLVNSSSLSQFDAIGLSSGNNTIKVVAVLDSIQMTSEAISIEIFSVQPPMIDTIGNTTFFEGDSVILVAPFGIDYFWSNGENTPTITVSEAGAYAVEVTDLNNCSSLSTAVEITVIFDPDAILITTDGSPTICEGESILLTANQTDNVQWLKNGWPIEGANDRVLEVTAAGDFQAQYTDITGVVVLSEIITIDLLPGLELDFEVNNNVITQNETVQFSILNDNLTLVEWNFGDTSSIASTAFDPVYQYGNIGFYDVQLYGVDDRGCTDTLVKTNFLQVISNTASERKDDVFIASAFTPNGDGDNDLLLVRGTDIAQMQFSVYSDNGYLVFESDTQNYGWDGTLKNIEAPTGNYIYQLNYTNLLGIDKIITGKTTLLK